MPVVKSDHPLLLKVRDLPNLIIGYYAGLDIFLVDNEYSKYFESGVLETRNILYWLDIPPFPPKEVEAEDYKD